MGLNIVILSLVLHAITLCYVKISNSLKIHANIHLLLKFIYIYAYIPLYLNENPNLRRYISDLKIVIIMEYIPND
jgi:hypothetical protein